MINPEVFAAWLEELAAYYGRKIGPLLEAAWYKQLGQKMTTEQFVEAAEKAIFSETFMPTPEKLLELVKGNSEVQALEEWNKCLKAAARGDREAIASLSPSSMFALQSIGGFRQLELSEESSHPWMQKRFVASWQAAKRDNNQPALPPAAKEKSPMLPPEVEERFRALVEKTSMNGNSKWSEWSGGDC